MEGRHLKVHNVDFGAFNEGIPVDFGMTARCLNS